MNFSLLAMILLVSLVLLPVMYQWAYRRQQLSHREALTRAGIQCLFFLAANLLTVLFVSQEQGLYSFDYAEYWARTLSYLNYFQHNGLRLNVLWKQLDGQFSIFPYPPLCVGAMLFGQDRAGFLVSIIAFLAFPAVLLLTQFASLFRSEVPCQRSAWTDVAQFSLPVLFPHFWAVIWKGFPDVGGLMFVFAVLALYFSKTVFEWSSRRIVLMGALLACMILFRRWYAYWVVSFLVAAAVDCLYQAMKTKRFHISDLWRTSRLCVISAGTAALLLYLLAPQFFKSALSSNISNLYTVYRRFDDRSFPKELFEWFGISIWLLVLAGFVIAWRRPENRRMLLFLILQLGIQIKMIAWGMLDHHGITYLYHAPFLVFLIIGLSDLLSTLRTNFSKVLVWASVAGILLINSACVFCPRLATLHQQLRPWVPVRPVYPLVREDTPAIAQLVKTVDSALTPGAWIYVLSSSEIFNETLIQHFNIFQKTRYLAPHQILPTVHYPHQAINNQQFPAYLSQAEIVLVAEPIQYHLRANDQKLVIIPADSFLKGEDLSQAYTKLPPVIQLDKGVQVHIFKKHRAVTPQEASALTEKLERELVPENKSEE